MQWISITGIPAAIRRWKDSFLLDRVIHLLNNYRARYTQGTLQYEKKLLSSVSFCDSNYFQLFYFSVLIIF